MNKYFVGFTCFALGGTAGFFAANKLLKDKYEQLVQDEIDSVKAAFKKEHPVQEKKKNEPTEQERKEYSKKVNNLGYSVEKKPVIEKKPYVISPEDFGAKDEYDTISLTYYSDGTVCDDNDRAMGDDEVEEVIGKESLSHFGEYEDDSVFVRNDRLKADYEILQDPRKYSDILKEKPYLVQN